MVDHFTVAYYYEKLELATAAVLLAAGITPTDPSAPRMTRCLTQFSQEFSLSTSTVMAGSNNTILTTRRR